MDSPRPQGPHEPQRAGPARSTGPSPSASAQPASLRPAPLRSTPSGPTQTRGGASGADHGADARRDQGARETTDEPARIAQGAGGRFTKVAVLALIAVGAVASFFALRGPQPAWDGPHVGKNWEYVQLAGESTTGGLVRVRPGHAAAAVASVEVAEADADGATTDAVLRALRVGDGPGADAALEKAQKIPDIQEALTKGDVQRANAKMAEVAGPQPAAVKPQITTGLAQGVMSGDTRFFHVFLYDNCAEDGDIVRIEINGQPFAMVPLTRTGATLSVPVGTGQDFDVRVVGIRDGGGGITVSCQTSTGAYFARAMSPGESQPLTFVAGGG